MDKTETKNEEVTVKKEASSLTKTRYNHKVRLWVIGILMAIVVVLFIFFEKLRVALIIAFIALLGAFGLEATQNDWDLQKLWETKSFEQSEVGRNVTTDKTVGKKADDYNCDDFSTQPEAQTFFLKVGGVGNDVNRLDGNKDGDACESLPKGTRK